MKGTYRSFRFQVTPTVTYEDNGFGTLEVATESWRYRIQNQNSQIVYDSSLADPQDNQPFFTSAVNAAIAKTNQLIADGETPPVFDPAGPFI